MHMEDKLWYTHSTEQFMEGLPLGNGRLAAMVLGRPERLRLALNHEWLWRGEHRRRQAPESAGYLPQVRDALLAGDYARGTELANRYFAGDGGISGRPSRVDPYQPAGDLWLELENPGVIAGYRRELSLSRGVASIRFSAACGWVQQRLCISAADGCGVLWVRCQRPAGFSLRLTRKEDPLCALEFPASPEEVAMAGRLAGDVGFEVSVKVETDGTAAFLPGSCRIAGATELLALFQVGTGAEGQPPRAEMAFPPRPWSWDRLCARHERRFAGLLGPAELSLHLPESPLPTDQRVAAFRDGQDPLLPLTYFHYGRYLLASGSSGALPLNLQGKWNEDLDPPWQCDYHMDVNLQMCYWCADMLGMDRAYAPFFALAERFVPHGREAARRLYGCRGVYFALQTDPWGPMTPESCGWAVWTGAAPWMAQHFFRHYQYTGDEDFLRNHAYPFLKEVVAFYEDYFIKRGQQLAIVPSQSPENRFVGSGGQYPVSICVNSAMDLQLAQEVFSHAVQAAHILWVDAAEAACWEAERRMLPPQKVGSQGQLLEWEQEFTEVEPGHRHFSHLYGLYPGELFPPDSALGRACERALELRLSHGGGHTGWSRSWTACLMARLGRAQDAWSHLTALIADFATSSLLDLHPPRIFQIDGNMGGTAAVCEMLLRTQGDDLYLLPALPEAWPDGEARRFRGHGGLSVSFSWRRGRLAEVTVLSPHPRSLRLHFQGRCQQLEVSPRQPACWKP